MNNKVNRLHEQAFQVVYNERQSTIEELLNEDNSVTIHQKNFQVLAAELYKVHHGLTHDIIKDVFKISNVKYNFTNDSFFISHKNIKFVQSISKTISYLGPKICDLLPKSVERFGKY